MASTTPIPRAPASRQSAHGPIRLRRPVSLVRNDPFEPIRPGLEYQVPESLFNQGGVNLFAEGRHKAIPYPVKMISTILDLKRFLSAVRENDELYLDLQGVYLPPENLRPAVHERRLSQQPRDRTLGHAFIGLLTILVCPWGKAFIIDLATLSRYDPNIVTITSSASPEPRGLSILEIMESQTIMKHFWDLQLATEAFGLAYNIVIRHAGAVKRHDGHIRAYQTIVHQVVPSPLIFGDRTTFPQDVEASLVSPLPTISLSTAIMDNDSHLVEYVYYRVHHLHYIDRTARYLFDNLPQDLRGVQGVPHESGGPETGPQTRLRLLVWEAFYGFATHPYLGFNIAFDPLLSGHRRWRPPRGDPDDVDAPTHIGDPTTQEERMWEQQVWEEAQLQIAFTARIPSGGATKMDDDKLCGMRTKGKRIVKGLKKFGWRLVGAGKKAVEEEEDEEEEEQLQMVLRQTRTRRDLDAMLNTERLKRQRRDEREERLRWSAPRKIVHLRRTRCKKNMPGIEEEEEEGEGVPGEPEEEEDPLPEEQQSQKAEICYQEEDETVVGVGCRHEELEPQQEHQQQQQEDDKTASDKASESADVGHGSEDDDDDESLFYTETEAEEYSNALAVVFSFPSMAVEPPAPPTPPPSLASSSVYDHHSDSSSASIAFHSLHNDGSSIRSYQAILDFSLRDDETPSDEKDKFFDAQVDQVQEQAQEQGQGQREEEEEESANTSHQQPHGGAEDPEEEEEHGNKSNPDPEADDQEELELELEEDQEEETWGTWVMNRLSWLAGLPPEGERRRWSPPPAPQQELGDIWENKSESDGDDDEKKERDKQREKTLKDLTQRGRTRKSRIPVPSRTAIDSTETKTTEKTEKTEKTKPRQYRFPVFFF